MLNTQHNLARPIQPDWHIPIVWGRAKKRKRLVEAVMDLPISVPHTAARIALLMVFGSRGLLGKPLAGLTRF